MYDHFEGVPLNSALFGVVNVLTLVLSSKEKRG